MGWFTNRTGRPVHIGGKVIAPGESRPVPDQLVPGMAPPSPPPAARPEVVAVAEILDRKVAEVRDALPALADGDLDTAEAMEHEGRGRKGVLEAIAEERLARAGAGWRP